MFDEIINSKKISHAAAAFFSLPPRSYSIGEAASLLKMPQGAAAHMLNKLVSHNLMRAFTKQGKKYYFLNTKLDVPAWVRSKILKRKKKLKDKLLEDIKKLKVRSAFLSGVFAGYTNLPVDLLLVGKVDLKKLDKFLDYWQKAMGLELNYSIMSEKEFILRRDTFDKFIKDVFDHRHIMVVDRLGKK